MSLSKEDLISKREKQLESVNEINRMLSEKQQETNSLAQSLTLNQGALYQLNMLLEEMGVDLSTLGQEEVPAAEGEEETATES
jgi:hypothetical protein